MKLFKPIEKFSYVPKYMCLLDGISFSKEVMKTEHLPCDVIVTKKLCLTTTTFNQKEVKDMLLGLSMKKIYTDEDIFLKDIDKHKVWFLYQPMREKGILKIDDLSILGRTTYIGENEVVSENEIKQDNYAPVDNCNFDYFKQFVLKNEVYLAEFHFLYKDAVFEIYYQSQEEGNNPNPELLLKIENVGKTYCYPYVLYFLKKIQADTNEKIIQSFKATQGYLG